MPRPLVFRAAGDFYVRLERFEWEGHEGMAGIKFHITELLEAIAKAKIPYHKLSSPIDHDWVQSTLIPSRNVNKSWAMSLWPSFVSSPILGAYMSDGSVLLIDGTHRYYRRWADGETYVDWHILAEPVWRPFSEPL